MHVYGTPKTRRAQHLGESAPNEQSGLEHISSVLARVLSGIEAQAGSPSGLSSRPPCLPPAPQADHPEHAGGPRQPSEALPWREFDCCPSGRVRAVRWPQGGR